MSNKILIVVLLCINGITSFLTAQVNRTVVVEHFTNTRCSVCASRNPGFYNNLANQQNVLHVAFHPSSPYSSCVISQSNTSENDGRAVYNGVYGGTPTLVIQGVPISAGMNYSSAAIFSPYLNQTSPVSIQSSLIIDNDSASVRVVVNTVAENTLGNLQLYAALTEDTLEYAAPNGENRHYDVFRKALSGNSGQMITLPALGDSLIFTYKTALQGIWNINQLSALVILQESSNRSVVQSQRSAGVVDITTQVSPIAESLKIFPNPAQNILYLEGIENDNSQVEIISLTGQTLKVVSLFNTNHVNIEDLPKGMYFIRLSQRMNTRVLKFQKQ